MVQRHQGRACRDDSQKGEQTDTYLQVSGMNTRKLQWWARHESSAGVHSVVMMARLAAEGLTQPELRNLHHTCHSWPHCVFLCTTHCLLMSVWCIPEFQKPRVGEGIWWRFCAEWQVCLSARAAMATVQRVAAVTFTAPLARPHPNLPRLKPGLDWLHSLTPLAESYSCSRFKHKDSHME